MRFYWVDPGLPVSATASAPVEAAAASAMEAASAAKAAVGATQT